MRPDAEHSFDCNGALEMMVFVDPESIEGARLSASLRQVITNVPDARLVPIVSAVRTFVNNPRRRRTLRHSFAIACWD